ncbi:hypothetical protein [Nostoc sp. JL33]|nr:hypothetical protein [Nostoc sp. JL33]
MNSPGGCWDWCKFVIVAIAPEANHPDSDSLAMSAPFPGSRI